MMEKNPQKILEMRKDTLALISTFYILKDSGYQPVKMTGMRAHGDHFAATIEGCNTPEDASRWTQSTLYLLVSDLPILPKGQFYWYSLIGMSVHNIGNQSYGEVTECYHTNHDVLKTSHGVHIPFLMGDTVISVDQSSNVIIVDYEWEDQEDSERDCD